MRTLALAAVLALAAPLLAADPPGWKAGFGTAVITPPAPMWMSGYASRTAPADGTETDLYAKAMALDDGRGHRAVLVTLDLVGISRDTSLAVCKLVTDELKLPRDAVALNTSHTHCGPVVGSNLRAMYTLAADENRKIDDYTAALPKLVLKAAAAAVADLRPAKLSWATGTAGFAVNRRENKEAEVPGIRAKGGELKGPIDHAVPVLAAHGEDGKLRGVVFGYACHATTLSFQKWCGDYPGFAMIELEKAHPGATAMFAAGCGADQNPLPRRTVELAKNYGKQLADAVEAVLKKPMAPLAAGWAGAYKEVPLPLAELPTREQLVKDSTEGTKYIALRAKMLLKQLEKGGTLPAAYPYPVQTWKLGGDLAMVFLGGEVVVDFSLRLKKELEAGKVWAFGYSNDVMAYIPSLRVLKEGGYEGASSMIYYGLPAVWGPAVEEVIVAEAHRQAKAVK